MASYTKKLIKNKNKNLTIFCKNNSSLFFLRITDLKRCNVALTYDFNFDDGKNDCTKSAKLLGIRNHSWIDKWWYRTQIISQRKREKAKWKGRSKNYMLDKNKEISETINYNSSCNRGHVDVGVYTCWWSMCVYI